jgi:hypothetical protein
MRDLGLIYDSQHVHCIEDPSPGPARRLRLRITWPFPAMSKAGVAGLEHLSLTRIHPGSIPQWSCATDPSHHRSALEEVAVRAFQRFILQTGTALHETDQTFDFAVGDWDGDGTLDLIAIKKSATGTNSTEVHVLSGAGAGLGDLIDLDVGRWSRGDYDCGTGSTLPESQQCRPERHCCLFCALDHADCVQRLCVLPGRTTRSGRHQFCFAVDAGPRGWACPWAGPFP